MIIPPCMTKTADCQIEFHRMTSRFDGDQLKMSNIQVKSVSYFPVKSYSTKFFGRLRKRDTWIAVSICFGINRPELSDRKAFSAERITDYISVRRVQNLNIFIHFFMRLQHNQVRSGFHKDGGGVFWNTIANADQGKPHCKLRIVGTGIPDNRHSGEGEMLPCPF